MSVAVVVVQTDDVYETTEACLLMLEADDKLNNISESVASDFTSTFARSAAVGKPRRPPAPKKDFIRCACCARSARVSPRLRRARAVGDDGDSAIWFKTLS